MSHISHAGISDIGRVRHDNQDRWFADPHVGLYLVADGMGGVAAGALAAQVVVEVLPRLLRCRLEGLGDMSDPVAHQCVVSAITELSERLHTEARDTYGSTGIGSTVVLAWIRDNQALVAHLGDSRAYRFHDKNVEQLTHDHSLVQALIDSGDITREQAEHHPVRGRLTRYVGMPGEPLPEVRSIHIAAGDRLLLCSDGLSGNVTNAQLGEIMQSHDDPREACHQLVSAANDSGGSDNITAIVVAVSADSPS